MARIQRMFPSAYRFVPPTWVGLQVPKACQLGLCPERQDTSWAFQLAKVIPDDFSDLEKRFGDNPESKAK